MKKTIVLIIMFLVFSICSVTAYTELEVHDGGTGSLTADGYHATVFKPINAASFNSAVTRFTITGKCHRSGGQGTRPNTDTDGSWLIKNCGDASNTAYVTVTWHALSNHTWEDCSYDFVKNNGSWGTGNWYLGVSPTQCDAVNSNLVYAHGLEWTHTADYPTGNYGFKLSASNGYDSGFIQTIYGGLPPPPDASFSCTSSYPYLGTDLICTDTSTGSPTSWSWNFDRPDGTNSGNVSTFNTLGFEVTQVGNYIVEMTATNSYGSDTVSYIIHGRYSGNETVTNVTNIGVLPTLPTGLPNPVNVNNLRNSILNHSAYGNMSWGYINTVDTFAEFINGSMSVIIGIFTTPIDWFTDAIGTIVTDMVTLTEPLIETASIFLQVVTRALIALPAVFVNIVTLGLIIDLIRLIIGGRQNT